MKVIAFNGSPRKEGNTFNLINRVFRVLEKYGIETELIQLGGKPLKGCLACYKCRETKDLKCSNKSDDLNLYLQKMKDADGIILGSPTYFANVTAEMKALIDRAGFVSRGNGNILKRKVGAAIVAVRRAGSLPVFDAINHFFLINEVIVPGSSYWNLGMGMHENDVDNDPEGIKTMETLGENMAWLLKQLPKPK